MRALVDEVGPDELALVQDLLKFVKGPYRDIFKSSGIVKRLEEYEYICRLIEEFLRTYMHKDEHRQTNFFCRLSYQQLLNSGIFKEMKDYEDCQTKSRNTVLESCLC